MHRCLVSVLVPYQLGRLTRVLSAIPLKSAQATWQLLSTAATTPGAAPAPGATASPHSVRSGNIPAPDAATTDAAGRLSQAVASSKPAGKLAGKAASVSTIRGGSGSSDKSKGVPERLARPKKKSPALIEADLDEIYSRGSGKGGQSVAKTCNRVQLTHLPTGLAVAVHTTRNRDLNRRIARKRLAEKVSLLLEGKESYAQVREDKKREKQVKAHTHSKGKHEWRAYLKQVMEYHEGKEQGGGAPPPPPRASSSSMTPIQPIRAAALIAQGQNQQANQAKPGKQPGHQVASQVTRQRPGQTHGRVGRTHGPPEARHLGSFKARRRTSMFRSYRHAVRMGTFKRVRTRVHVHAHMEGERRD